MKDSWLGMESMAYFLYFGMEHLASLHMCIFYFCFHGWLI